MGVTLYASKTELRDGDTFVVPVMPFEQYPTENIDMSGSRLAIFCRNVGIEREEPDVFHMPIDQAIERIERFATALRSDGIEKDWMLLMCERVLRIARNGKAAGATHLCAA